MTEPSLQSQASELLCVGQERAAHIETLERIGKTPPEVIALKRQRLEVLRAAYRTLRALAEGENKA